jgi:hypothetical protein
MDSYYRIDTIFTIHPDGVLNVFAGQYKDTNLLFINNGYTKKYIFFRLNVLISTNPKVLHMPISLKQIKDPNLIEQIKLTREYILLTYA